MSNLMKGQTQYMQSPMGYGGFGGQQYGGGFGGYGQQYGGGYGQQYGGGYGMGGYADPYGQMSGFGNYGGFGGFGGYGDPYGQIGGGYGGFGGFGGFGGYGQQPLLPPPQPTVNDLFSRYFSQQYYGGPSFDPFSATSLFGGGFGGGYGYGGGGQGGAGFGGGRGMRRGGRQRFQQQQPTLSGPDFSQFFPPKFGSQTPSTPPAQTPNPSTTVEYWMNAFRQDNPNMSDEDLRRAAEQRVGQVQASASPAQTSAQNPNLYSTANDDWGLGEPFDYTQIPANFNWQSYLDAPGNADLRAAGVDTPSEAAKHYLKYGINENRQLGAPAAPQSTAQPIMQPAVQPQYEYAMPYGGSSMFDVYSGLYSPFGMNFRF